VKGRAAIDGPNLEPSCKVPVFIVSESEDLGSDGDHQIGCAIDGWQSP
jgi:hypothetical protein